MTSRIPEPEDPMEAEGIPDPWQLEPEQAATGQAEGTIEPPHDIPMLVDDFGTTAKEMHDGEPLDLRLSREEPDVFASVDAYPDESVGQSVGRLVEPDEGARTDDEPDLVATDVGTDLGGFSAEEAAMHVVPEV
jgi:hypothetical protein